MMTFKILLVDSDKQLQHLLAEQFELYGDFEMVVSDTASRAMQIAADKKIDLLITEVKLPDMDGREAIKILRKKKFNAPILIISAKKSEPDIISGLESGANDYIAKPFKISVLIAKLRAHLREYKDSENLILKIGGHKFFVAQKIFKKENGKRIKLTEKETDILKYLHLAEQKCITRKKILTEVWGYNSGVATHTLETHIYRLRSKVENNPKLPQFLCTCENGYRLMTKK